MSRSGEAFAPESYGGLPGFKEPSTSRDAARAVAGKASQLRERIFDLICAAGMRGLTPDEAAALIPGSDWRGVRPRFSELAKAQRIVPTGERRANDTGLKARVWRAK